MWASAPTGVSARQIRIHDTVTFNNLIPTFSCFETRKREADLASRCFFQGSEAASAPVIRI